MNITIQKVLDTASKHILVNETGEGDIYEYLNSGEHKYPCVFLTVTKVTDNEYNRTLGGTLFYVDRLVSDQSNKTAVQSTAVSVLRDILQAVDNEQESVEYMTFTEKFTDLCAGAYADCQISVSFTDACTDNFELITKDITENGVYEITGYDRAIVSVDQNLSVISELSAVISGLNDLIETITSLTINENGTYTPPEGVLGYNTINVSVGGDPLEVFSRLNACTLDMTRLTYLSSDLYPFLSNPSSIALTNKVLLKELNFPDGSLLKVTSLNIGYMPNITQITFPENSLNQISTMNSMFDGNNRLTSLIFPEGSLKNVTSAISAFQYCSKLSSITFPEGALTQCTNLSYGFYYCSQLTSISLPDIPRNVVLQNCFHSCYKLTSINLGITELNSSNFNNTFYNCKSITNTDWLPVISVNGSMNAMMMFVNCSSLQNANITINCSKLSSTYMLSACSNLTYAKFNGTVGGFSSFSNMFYNDTALNTVIFPETYNFDISMYFYGSNMFYNCKSLENLEIYNLPKTGSILFGFQYCPFTVSSLLNIINALPEVTSNLKITLGTTNLSKLSTDQILIATNKGWTLN